ncbi:MAG: transcriptional regulator [Alkalispirochaeta sp.]
MSNLFESEARDDFNRARKNAFFSQLFSLFAPERQELLSLQEVKDVLKPRGETYRGMQEVPIDRIVGSEGRYRDFNKQFLPRHEYLRNRWQRVDMAHLTDVILPPIALYEIGGVYFVRDGNHRVSVAKAQGVKQIDAEVVALDTEIPLQESLTRDHLREAVIEHERKIFCRQMPVDRVLPECDLSVSATGRYDELTHHVYGHKYFLNEHETVEIPLERALRSWYDNVYRPIVDVVRENNLMARFPGRTETDMYLWIVKHWDQLKRRYGPDFPVQQAARDYSERYGRGGWHRIKDGVLRLIRKR